MKISYKKNQLLISIFIGVKLIASFFSFFYVLINQISIKIVFSYLLVLVDITNYVFSLTMLIANPYSYNI